MLKLKNSTQMTYKILFYGRIELFQCCSLTFTWKRFFMEFNTDGNCFKRAFIYNRVETNLFSPKYLFKQHQRNHLLAKIDSIQSIFSITCNRSDYFPFYPFSLALLKRMHFNQIWLNGAFHTEMFNGSLQNSIECILNWQ